MRTIGIDLAVAAAHKAVVMGPDGRFVTPVWSFHTHWREIEQLVSRAREGQSEDAPLQAVMEPTGMAWLAVSVVLERLGVQVYLVNGQKAHDLRRYYKRHSSSDRISARVLAKMGVIDKESLYPLVIPTIKQLACQRGCKELNRLQTQIAAIKNRLRDIDRFAWPGLEGVFKNIYSPMARVFRQTWYNPIHVVAAGAEQVQASFRTHCEPEVDLAWVDDLVRVADSAVRLYGPQAIDYDLLQQEVTREQHMLAELEQRADTVWRDTVRPLYRQLHPDRHLETLYGVGEQGAAVYVSFIGTPSRFPNLKHFRGWHGMIPDSRQSGQAESKGLHISQAGPDVVQKFAYLDANIARQYDPQIAAIYYEQMMHKGNHHNQAVCACATHLLDRVFVVLREGRPYELRDLDGSPVTPKEARTIVTERYTVPDEVRTRNNRRARKQRAEQRLERKFNKRSRSRR
jgi:transposase